MVGDAAGDDDPLAERLARVLAREIGVELLHGALAERRAGRLGHGVGNDQQRAPRRPALRRAVVGIEVRRVGPLLVGDLRQSS